MNMMMINMKILKNIYQSVITRTNWIDEMEYGLPVGILIKVDPKEINKNGYNLQYIPINNITHTVLVVDQLLQSYKIYIKKNNSLFDEQNMENIISGFGVGNGNCILPLLLIKNH